MLSTNTFIVEMKIRKYIVIILPVLLRICLLYCRCVYRIITRCYKYCEFLFLAINSYFGYTHTFSVFLYFLQTSAVLPSEYTWDTNKIASHRSVSFEKLKGRKKVIQMWQKIIDILHFSTCVNESKKNAGFISVPMSSWCRYYCHYRSFSILQISMFL